MDTARLGEVEVENGAGERVRLGSFWEDGDALLVFVRHFGCAGEGRFVGEMSFLTGEPPAADVEALAPIRLVTWPTPALKEFLAENADLRATLQLVIGTDLVAKLRSPSLGSPLLRSPPPDSAPSP